MDNQMRAAATAKLSELFGGRGRFELLRALYLNPSREFTNRELAEAARVDAGNSHRWLNKWADLGLVVKQTQGRTIVYRATDDPLLDGLREIILRNDRIVEDIEAALPRSVEVAVIFGSAARGEERAGSDIDVLALGEDLSTIKINAVMRSVRRKHRREINVTALSTREFEQLLKKRDSFALSVASQRTIPLRGRFPYGA
jgi:predicted nucleotidyltransferase